MCEGVTFSRSIPVKASARLWCCLHLLGFHICRIVPNKWKRKGLLLFLSSLLAAFSLHSEEYPSFFLAFTMTVLHGQLCHLSPATLALICAFFPPFPHFSSRKHKLLNLPQIPNLPCLLLRTDSRSTIYLSLDPLVSTVVSSTFCMCCWASRMVCWVSSRVEGWGVRERWSVVPTV